MAGDGIPEIFENPRQRMLAEMEIGRRVLAIADHWDDRPDGSQKIQFPVSGGFIVSVERPDR